MLRAETGIIGTLTRTSWSGPADRDGLVAMQQQFRIRPLSEFTGAKPPVPAPTLSTGSGSATLTAQIPVLRKILVGFKSHTKCASLILCFFLKPFMSLGLTYPSQQIIFFLYIILLFLYPLYLLPHGHLSLNSFISWCSAS